IVLWPNGVKILLALGVGDRLGHIGHTLERVVTRTNQGEPLTEMPVGELERKLGAPVYPVSRTDLQSLLVDAVGPGALRLGARCARVEQTTANATAHFEDGRTATGDVVLGATGSTPPYGMPSPERWRRATPGWSTGWASSPTTDCCPSTSALSSWAKASAAACCRWPATGYISASPARWTRESPLPRPGGGASCKSYSVAGRPPSRPSSTAWMKRT